MDKAKFSHYLLKSLYIFKNNFEIDTKIFENKSSHMTTRSTIAGLSVTLNTEIWTLNKLVA